MKRQIGLDFSTTTTVITYQDRDNGKNSKPEVLFFNGNPYVPTVIMEEGTLTNKKGIEIHYEELFGWDAENKAQNNAYSLLKSNFKMELISEKSEERQEAEKLTEKFFQYLYEYYTNHADHPKNTSVDISTVVTYPAKFSEKVQQFLKEAAEKAGFTNVALLDEAKAAMAYSLAYETETIKKYVESIGKQKLKVMLIDMGAGTTDIAVFEYDMSNPTNFSHICSWPKTNGVTFGGGEIDGILCDFYKRKLGKEITSMIGKGNSALGEMLLRSQVKKYKEDVLSKLEEGEETTYLPGSLDYMPNAEDAYLDRALFEDLLKEYLSKFPKLVNGALKEAEMTSEQVDMVLLTGGHSQWYFVKKMLIEQGISGNSIFDFSDPHLVVAKGAALYVEKERKVKKPLYQEQKSSVSVVEENKIDLIHEAISIRKGIIDISKIFANPFRINDATKTLKMEYDPKNILRPVIASGKECIAAVDKNGRVWIAGRSSFEKAKVYEWKNIVSVAVGRSFILGLASDGSVKKVDDGIFQIDVSKWKNIISIVACDNAAFGLKNDGTVVYAGRSRRINRIVSTWDSITSIAISRNDGTVWGVKSDGKLLKCESMFQTDSGVYYIPNVMMVRSQNLVNRVVLERSGKVKCDEQYIPNWTNIVAIDHWSHTVGLKADGTVVAYGTENNGKLNVSHWCEMIAVAVGLYWTIGLRADGTVSVAYKPDSLTHPLPYEEIRRWKLF